MGSAQREATVVAIGLVIVATLVVVYMFNEPNRRDVAAEEKVEDSVERGADLFVQYCVACHGPEGLGSQAGRIGAPLNTEQNQTEDEIEGDEREKILHDTIARGRGAIMPAWSEDEGGPLKEQHIQDLVTLIREGEWDVVHELAVETAGGAEPTIPPTATLPPDLPPEEEGKALFGQVCAGCHISNDFPDGGVFGPDLTGLGAMEQTQQVGIGVNEEELTAWINDPQAIKPGTAMPLKGGATDWGDEEVQKVVQYLLSLE